MPGFNSNMVRLKGGPGLGNKEKLHLFQFQYGTIKSRDNFLIPEVLSISFNSNMVRLKESINH